MIANHPHANKRPIAQGIASLGRGKDTMLVHMTPGEVQGLQKLAMAHGGSLTINPQTGLPEAGFLSSMLPMLIGAGLMMIPGMQPFAAAAITGAGYGAATGSLKKGLMAGIGAYGGAGLGQGLAAAGEAGVAATPTNTLTAAQSNIDPTFLEGMSKADIASGAMTPPGYIPPPEVVNAAPQSGLQALATPSSVQPLPSAPSAPWESTGMSENTWKAQINSGSETMPTHYDTATGNYAQAPAPAPATAPAQVASSNAPIQNPALSSPADPLRAQAEKMYSAVSTPVESAPNVNPYDAKLSNRPIIPGLKALGTESGRDAFLGTAETKSAEATGVGGLGGLAKYSLAAATPAMMEPKKLNVPGTTPTEYYNTSYSPGERNPRFGEAGQPYFINQGFTKGTTSRTANVAGGGLLAFNGITGSYVPESSISSRYNPYNDDPESDIIKSRFKDSPKSPYEKQPSIAASVKKLSARQVAALADSPDEVGYSEAVAQDVLNRATDKYYTRKRSADLSAATGGAIRGYDEGGDVQKQQTYQSPFQIQQDRPDATALNQYMSGLNKSLQGAAAQKYSAPSLNPTGTTSSNQSIDSSGSLVNFLASIGQQTPEVPTYSYTPPKPIGPVSQPSPGLPSIVQPVTQPTTSPSFTSNGVIPGTELPAYTFNPTGQPATQPTTQPTAPSYFPSFDEFKSTYTPPPPPTPQGEITRRNDGEDSYYQDETGQKFSSSGGEDASYTPMNWGRPEDAYQKLIDERMAAPAAPAFTPTSTPPTRPNPGDFMGDVTNSEDMVIGQRVNSSAYNSALNDYENAMNSYVPTYSYSQPTTQPTYAPPTQQPTSQPSDGGMVTDQWGNTFYQPAPPPPPAPTPTADVMPRSTDSDTGGIASLIPPDSTPMGGDLRGMVQPPIPQPQTPPPPPPAPEVPTYQGNQIYANENGNQVYRDEEGRERRVPDEHPSDRAGGPIKAKKYAMGGIATLQTYAAGGKLLNGDGDGMSDSIPAVINGPRPQRAALADGEFVIPADVVSHLGNGSTKAGAKRLYQMMDKVRMARVGTKKQGKQINPDKFMPA